MLADLVVQHLFDDNNKAKIIKQLNANVNIPILTESTEAKVFEALFEVLEEAVKQALKK